MQRDAAGIPTEAPIITRVAKSGQDHAEESICGNRMRKNCTYKCHTKSERDFVRC